VNNPSLNDPKGNANKAGTVNVDDGYATLRYERRLPHSLEEVWNAITDPKEVSVWFSVKARIDARPGGSVEYISVPAGKRISGRILVWDPPHVFEHEFHMDPHPQHPDGDAESIVRWELTRDGSDNNSTILTLIHRRLTKDNSLRYGSGWPIYLDRLVAQLGGKRLSDLRKC
jgi:uncharacterized protein YndB with AHSA1/START domain